MLTRKSRRVGAQRDAGDEILLTALASRGELDVPMRWIHHFFMPDEASARDAFDRAVANGWALDWMSAQPEPFAGWLLRVCRDVPVNREVVQQARGFFDDLARATGGTYGGWDVRRIPKHALAGNHE